MTFNELSGALTDIKAVASTIYGEARNEPLAGMVAVGNVIRNRVIDPRWPDTFKGVCLQKAQFSCWMPGGGVVNHQRTLASAEALVADRALDDRLVTCVHVAEGIVAGLYRDNSLAADHYLTRALYRSIKPPAWARKGTVTAEIGAHVFLKV